MITDSDSRGRAAVRAASPGGWAAIVGFVALVALVPVALAAPVEHTRSTDGEYAGVPIDELKQIYLTCDRAAASARLSTEGIWQCSIVYEELKRRAFGGDFDRLRAWSRANPSEVDAGR